MEAWKAPEPAGGGVDGKSYLNTVWLKLYALNRWMLKLELGGCCYLGRSLII